MKPTPRRRKTRGQRHAAAAAARTGWCACAKVSFPTVAAARRVKNDVDVQGDGEMLRIYACPNMARTWHVTSRGPHREVAE